MSADTLIPLQEAEKLSPNAIISMFVLDATGIGGGIFRFSPLSRADGSDIVWQGDTYTRFPLKAEGYEFSTKGELPRPRVTFSNLFGVFTALNLGYQDLTRARFTRKRCYKKNLDGEAQANPNASYPDDVFFIGRKIIQNKQLVQYELVSSLEIDGPQIPARQVFSNRCAWKYRSAECSYTDIPVADRNGNPCPVALTSGRGTWSAANSYTPGEFVTRILDPITLRPRYFVNIVACAGILTEPPNETYWFEDECSKRIEDGCKPRFGPAAPIPHDSLPFGGFPGSRLLDTGE
jgi:lambda family phage minor tail protein L